MRRPLLAAVAGLALAAPSAQAAQLTVTTTEDAPGVCVDGACTTLRAALDTAAGTAETDTIQLPAGDYALSGELAVPGGVTLTGASARTTTVRGDGRVFNVAAGESSIARLTIGGGVLNAGTLTLDRVHASGIVNPGALTLTRALVDGGGVSNTGTLTASDSTIASNPDGGIVGDGTGTLTRVTLVRNGTAPVGGTLHVRGSLLDRCGPGLVSDGGNLLPFDCGISGPGDLFGQDAKLGTALVNAGGDTDVLRIAPGSAAAGLAGACMGADQRELARPQGSGCDAGAYEIEVVQVTGPDGPTRSADATFSFTAAPGSTFRCKLDGDEEPCTSPADYPGLTEGEHTFTVQAIAGDEAVSDPVSRTFTVDTAAPPRPVVDTPHDGDLLIATPIAFSGTVAEDGDAVVISEGGVLRGRVNSRADRTWDTTIPATDGTHVYDVTAEDAAGNPSAPVTLTVHVDATAPAAPEIDSPAEGSAQQSTTVTLSGRTEPGATVEVLEGSESRGTAKADAGGAWTRAISDVGEGMHAYTATATDAAGHTGPPSAPRSVRVDRTPPSAPQVSGGPDGFTLVGDADAALACSLDGGAFAPCASGVAYPGLAPGDHVLVVRATDAAGNESATEHRFSVAVVAAATPTPSPVATPSFRRTVVLRPQAGRTLIRRPGETAFTEIRSRTAVPLGSTVDVRQGAVIVLAATATTAETAKFSGGIFTASGTDLTLSETLRCGRARRLTGDGAGAFRIRGRYAAATGRGARWTVKDTCKLTRISVFRGVVAVRAGRARKTLLIRAGRSYTARSKR